jgi:ArsR family transcriptional regulator
VETALLESLGEGTLGRLLDIGTGTGRIAELLADRAEHVVALDKSTEMLRLARARLQSFPPQKVELVQGDFASLPFGEDEFDTVVLHQVLHYAQEPAQALAEAARVCRPGGRIAVVDLATHEREELRQRHAHARLGFSDEQMLEWLTESGFAPSLPIALPGKGLTTKIWLANRNEHAATGRKAEKANGSS